MSTGDIQKQVIISYNYFRYVQSNGDNSRHFAWDRVWALPKLMDMYPDVKWFFFTDVEDTGKQNPSWLSNLVTLPIL